MKESQDIYPLQKAIEMLKAVKRKWKCNETATIHYQHQKQKKEKKQKKDWPDCG